MLKSNKILTYISSLKQLLSYKKRILFYKDKKVKYTSKVNKNLYLKNIKIKSSQFL